ncbi:DUF4231 domain-containing protein [Streptomyces griseorubiginosus]|uniref:DUF4231 domain-containing protein n=1 Tax=Streptomyces griseorubiginosus TaxID=67304 RepID=UPI00076D518A|nr:DUF4231 domain-containing protein [Streptomyces griseorubiginosus]KUM75916.1 hypothetical protein AQI84_17110 [Streptomyces griseorubiginosus]
MFRSNDQWALTRQSEAFRATMTQLALLLVATVFATLADHFDSHVLTAVSALLYGLTVVTGVVVQRRRARAHWQAHRDAAETVKSLAWQYMVHGGPFHSKVRDPDGLFNQQLEEHLRGLRRIGWKEPAPERAPGTNPGPVPASSAYTLWDPASRHEPDDPRHPQITRAMRAVREKPFAVRKDIYLRDRVLDQLSWYGGRAVQARRSAALWSALTALLTLLALVAAVSRSAGLVSGWDLSGLLAAAAATGVAWLETRRHHPLSFAHALVREGLETQRAVLAQSVAEDRWPQAVTDTEHLMLPQHTDWLARFGG